MWRNSSIHCRHLSAAARRFRFSCHTCRAWSMLRVPWQNSSCSPPSQSKTAAVSLKFKRQLMINESRILPREAHSCIFHSCAPKIVYGHRTPGRASSLLRVRSALLCQTESWQHMCDISMWPAAAIRLGSNCTAACTDVPGATRARSVEAHGVYQWKETLPPSGIKVT